MTLREAAERLAAAGCDTPGLDAEVLLAHALGITREELLTKRGRTPFCHAEGFGALVARREAREPVAYITGVKHFRRLALHVDERVLIPRPETEHVVEAALGLSEGARVVDVGTGSGAIALALKDERPDLDVTGTDVSEQALEVARANAERLGLDVALDAGNMLVPSDVDGVVCNPPYVRDDEVLPPEVMFEPSLALRAGREGLDAYRQLIPRLRGTFVALEVGEGQSDAVRALLEGWDSEVHRDLAGIERVVVGRR